MSKKQEVRFTNKKEEPLQMVIVKPKPLIERIKKMVRATFKYTMFGSLCWLLGYIIGGR